MTYGTAYGESAYGAGAAEATGFDPLPAPDRLELSSEPFSRGLPAAQRLEVSSEYVTTATQLDAPDRLELNATPLRVALPGPDRIELTSGPMAPQFPAPDALELNSETLTRNPFAKFRPLILESEVLFGFGAADWNSLHLVNLTRTQTGSAVINIQRD